MNTGDDEFMKVFYCKNFIEKNKYLKYKYSMKNLTKERQERLKVISDSNKKESFMMSEFITIEILEKHYGIQKPEILGKAGEKPLVKNTDRINFSRSYADKNMVIAIDVDHQVGVDCEQIISRDRKVMEYFFTDEEKEYVAKSSDKDLAFTVIWTRKESYMKYTGEGLATQFQLLNMAPDDVDRDQVDTISSVLISKITLEASQKFKDLRLKENNELYVKIFIVNNTVISITGEEPSMRKIDYQEKRSYGEENNRLFWKNSQSIFEENSDDRQNRKGDI